MRVASRRQEGPLELDEDPTDDFDRTLAYVRYPGNALYNRTLVRRGLAEVLIIAPNDRYEQTLLAAQRQAKSEGLGIWGSGRCEVGGAGAAPPERRDPQPPPAPAEDPSPPSANGSPGGEHGASPIPGVRRLPDTGGFALISVAALLVGSGTILGLAVLRRSSG